MKYSLFVLRFPTHSTADLHESVYWFLRHLWKVDEYLLSVVSDYYTEVKTILQEDVLRSASVWEPLLVQLKCKTIHKFCSCCSAVAHNFLIRQEYDEKCCSLVFFFFLTSCMLSTLTCSLLLFMWVGCYICCQVGCSFFKYYLSLRLP